MQIFYKNPIVYNYTSLNYFDLNEVAIYWNAFCSVKNCSNLIHPASDVGCVDIDAGRETLL